MKQSSICVLPKGFMPSPLARQNPLLHYVLSRRGGETAAIPDFDPEHYLRRFPDVAESGYEPYEHFVRFGQQEGRFL